MSQTFTLELDKPRAFTFTLFQCQAACRSLNALGYQVFQQPINSGTLPVILGSDTALNADALAAIIHAGLLDNTDQKVRTHNDCLRLVSGLIADGLDLEPVFKTITAAGIAFRVWRPREGEPGAEAGNASPSRSAIS